MASARPKWTMIPDFVDGLNLPPGNHPCSWDELEDRFCYGRRRPLLCGDLRHLLEKGKACGFVGAVIWGSFATGKEEPGDLDLLFIVRRGVTKADVSPECAEIMDPIAGNERYGHDFLYCHDEPETISTLTYSLGIDKITKKDRGTLLLDLLCL